LKNLLKYGEYKLDLKEDFENVKCNLCGSNSSNKFFTGKDLLYKKEGLYTVVKCRDCGLIYTNPRPNQTIITNYYPSEYWEINENNQVDSESSFKKLAHRFINKISYKMTIPFKTNGKLLDIGCGDGKELLRQKENGWDTYGVEINDLAANYVRKHYGLNVFTGIVEDAEFDDEFFDVIILNNVLEHMSDPKTTLNEIHRILKMTEL
jgi:SAM-dependent methyltransferase